MAAFELLEPRQLLATVTWDGGGGDLSWHNPLNWSGDAVPGPVDDVVINAPGEPTIQISQDASVHSLWSGEALSISAGTFTVASLWRQAAPLSMSGGRVEGAANLVVNGSFTWSGGVIAGTGKLQIVAGRELDITATVTLARDMTNDGTVVWQAGHILMANARINNLAGRTFEMRSVGSILSLGGFNIFTNLGVLARTGPIATATRIQIALNNPGTLDVRSGTLSLESAIVQHPQEILNGGTWIVHDHAVLDMGSSIILYVTAGRSDVTVWLDGTDSRFPSLGVVQGFIGSQAHRATLHLSGGRTVPFNGRLLIRDVDWLVMDNPGITDIPSEAVIGRLTVLQGVMRWTGASISWVNTTTTLADIRPGAELQTLGQITLRDVTGGGLLRISGSVSWFVGTWSGGSVLIDPGAELRLDGFITGENHLVAAKVLGRRLVNYGFLRWVDPWGSFQIYNTELVNRGVFNIRTAPGVDTGASPASVPSFITNFGTINKIDATTTTFMGRAGGIRLNNQGAVHVLAGRLILSGGVTGGGSWTVGAGAELAFGGLGATLTGATLGGAGLIRIADSSAWNGVAVTGSGPMIVTPAGRLSLRGLDNVVGRGGVANSGIIALSDGGVARIDASLFSPGTLALDTGELRITDDLTLSSISRVETRTTGPGVIGRMTIGEQVTIAGTLALDFAWAVPLGESFDLLTFAGRTGRFEALEFQPLPSGVPIEIYSAMVGRIVIGLT